MMAKPSLIIPMNLQMFAEPDEDFRGEEFEQEEETQEEESEGTTEDETEEKPSEDEEEEFDEITYNKETVKIPKSERKNYLQKGYNYDKVHGKAQAMETQLQRAARVQGFSSIEDYLAAVERAEMEVEAAEYAKANNLTQEEAQREMTREKRVQALEHEVRVTKLLSDLESEKAPFRDKMYFKELEPEIDKLVKDSAMRGQKLEVEIAFNFLRGQNLDELMTKAKSDTAKSTVAKIHDRARRGPTSSDGAAGDDVDTTDVDLKMAQAFGNDPKAIAKYVKKATKK